MNNRMDNRDVAAGTVFANAATTSAPHTFGDRYEVLRSLGEGGMGCVYEVFDRERGTRVALKTVQRLDADALYLFKSEFRATADVVHPGLVALYDLVADGPCPFFTMELVAGQSFLNWVQRNSAFHHADTLKVDALPDSEDLLVPEVSSRDPHCNLARLRSAARQLVESLLALHSAGKLHRDVKPSNVLVTEEGRVVMLDFGVTLDLGRDQKAPSTDVLGTPAYMSPEQAAGMALTPASDWYSVGVMLYEALTGRLPLAGSALKLMFDKQMIDPPPPSSMADVPEDIDGLCRDLLQRNPEQRPSGTEILRRLTGQGEAASSPAISTHATEMPFVGRDAQMQQLRDAFGKVDAEGKALVLHLRGSSGMGKSALLARFAERLAEEDNTVVIAGRCYEREIVPFNAFDSLVDALTCFLLRLPNKDVEGLLPRGILALACVFPVLLRVQAIAEFPRKAIDTPNPQELRRQAFSAFRELVGRMAIRWKVVLMLDDLQWGDSDSAVLLSELVRMPDAPPVLVILSCRTEEADASLMLAALRGVLRAEEQVHVEATPLAVADAEDLAKLLLADADAPESDRVRRIARESMGSPYFVDELVRFAKVGSGLDDASLRLEDALHCRISRLPDDSSALLRVVAVAGGIISEQVATRAANVQGEAARMAAAELRAGHLLRSTRSASALNTFHDRVRETVLAHLDAVTLRALHARLAEAFIASKATDPDVLTFHFGASGNRNREVEWALVAAKRAEDALAFDRVVALYKRALAIGIPNPQRLALLEALGDALTNAGRLGEAAELRLGLAHEVNSVRALQLKTLAAEQLLSSGRLEKGATVLEEVLRAVRIYVPKSPWAILVALVFVRLVLTLRGLNFRAFKDELHPAVAIGIDALIAASSGVSTTNQVLARYFSTRALLRALTSGNSERVVRALGLEAVYSANSGGFKARERTLAVLKRLGAVANVVGAPVARATLTLATGYFHLFVDHDFATAKGLFLKSERAFLEQCPGQAWMRTWSRLMASFSMATMGEPAELALHVSAWLRKAEETEDGFELNSLRSRSVPWLCLANDEIDRSQEALATVSGLLPKHQVLVMTFYHLMSSAERDLYRGQSQAALEAVTMEWGRLRKSLLFRAVAIIRIQALDLRGRASLGFATQVSGKDRESRIGLAEAMAARVAREGTALSQGLAALLRAGSEAARFSPEKACHWAQEAERAFRKASMKLHVEASRWLRGTCRGGDEGAALVESARDAMVAIGIRQPDRFAAMLTPGIWFASNGVMR